MRVTEAQPDPETYNEPIKLGLFCHAESSSSSSSDGDGGADDDGLDTDSVLWQTAKILGITSLMLGLIDTLTVCTVLILPNICLKNAKSADLTWHCMSAFSCIAAILEVWALLPYASDVCDGANVCETGSGTWLLGFSFLFYFVSAVLVELTAPPVDHLKQQGGSGHGNNNKQGNNRGLPMEHEFGQHGPSARNNDGTDLPGFDIYSQSGYSNVSSITGASAFQQVIEEVDGTIAAAVKADEKKNKSSNASTQQSVVSSSDVSQNMTSWWDFSNVWRTPENSLTDAQPKNNAFADKSDKRAPSTAESTPASTPEKDTTSNNANPPPPAAPFVDVELANTNHHYSNNNNNPPSFRSVHSDNNIRRSPSPNTVHFVRGNIPDTGAINRTSSTRAKTPGRLATPRASPPPPPSASSGRPTPSPSPPNGILRKSRFAETEGSGSKPIAPRRRSPHRIDLRDNPEIRRQMDDAMDDPQWPDSIQVENPREISSSTLAFAARMAKKKVRMQQVGAKSLADSSDDESALY